VPGGSFYFVEQSARSGARIHVDAVASQRANRDGRLGGPPSQTPVPTLATALRPSVHAMVTSLLFEVRARDPFIVMGVVGLVGSIGLATCVFAARQGLAIDPASALRDE
jgi:hypothetical protein